MLPKTPESGKKAALSSILSYISTHPKAWLALSFLILQLLLFFGFRSFPAVPSSLHFSLPKNAVINNCSLNGTSGDPCASGKARNPVNNNSSSGDHPSTKNSVSNTSFNSSSEEDPWSSFPENPVINKSSNSSSRDPSISFPRNPVINHSSNSSSEDLCTSGKVYVYDLPPMFNTELLDNCQDFDPWSNGCAALANDGFGRRATGLDGIVPENLNHAWYWTNQFALEIIFHNRILKHQCRTLDPNAASAFFLPFYAGLAVGKYLWSNSSIHYRDLHCEMLLKWVQEQTFWHRSIGADHFMTMGRITWDFRRNSSRDDEWGSSCIHMPAMKNITRLLIERNPWDHFDVGVPYPTGFHPKTESDLRNWQQFVRSRNRTTLFCFAGAPRKAFKNDFRGILLNQCRNESNSCRTLDCAGSRCANGSSTILEMFLSSDFCLQPRGDSYTRRSIFDCMVAGSIPVFFWNRSAYEQYQWFLPDKPTSYSVFIDSKEVKNGISIKRVLERFSREEVRRMRETIIDSIPKFVYAEPKEGLGRIKDAFDVAIDGVFRIFKERSLYNSEEWKYLTGEIH